MHIYKIIETYYNTPYYMNMEKDKLAYLIYNELKETGYILKNNIDEQILLHLIKENLELFF